MQETVHTLHGKLVPIKRRLLNLDYLNFGGLKRIIIALQETRRRTAEVRC